MMTKILALIVTLSFGLAQAQDASDEALILNQELKFLEDAANDISIATNTDSTETNTPASTAPIGEAQSLEDAFFGSEADAVQTRTAAPVRAGDGRPRPRGR